MRPLQGRPVFIGWTAQGIPAITTTENELSQVAQKSYFENRKSKQQLDLLQYSNIIPVDYLKTGQPIDYQDTPQHKAEDLLSYSVLDSNGDQKSLTIGELNMLEGISNGVSIWQDLGKLDRDEIAATAKQMYTLFVEEEKQSGEAYAFMFQPPIEGQSNEVSFKSFIRQTLGKLLVLDESQNPSNRKGYIEAAADLTDGHGLSKLGMILNFFYDFGDDKYDPGNRFKAGIYNFARKIGFYEITDEQLEEMRRGLPYYDVDTMDLTTLMGVAKSMYKAAYNSFR